MAFDVFGSNELLESLIKNDKIMYDPEEKTFYYKHTYICRNREDLLELLKRNNEFGGLDYKELKDSFPNVLDTLNVFCLIIGI